MLKVSTTCDTCGKEVRGHHLNLYASLDIRPEERVLLDHRVPLLDRTYHFCNLACLNEFVQRKKTARA